MALREEVDKASMFEEIVGGGPALTALLSRVSRVASSDSTVLITGETCTGKELVARAIHRRSRRASRAFVAVNCAAIPRDLIASELFGREKGAFTGAVQRRLNGLDPLLSPPVRIATSAGPARNFVNCRRIAILKNGCLFLASTLPLATELHFLQCDFHSTRPQGMKFHPASGFFKQRELAC